MRLSKKILSLCIAAILSCMPLFASAESLINPVSPTADNAIVVSGKVDNAVGKNATLIFKMTLGETIVAAGSTKTTLDEQNNVVFAFDSLKLPLGLASGTYTITVLGERVLVPFTTSFEYNGPDRKLLVLKAISEADVVGALVTGTTMEKNNSEILGIDAALYTSLDETGKTAFEAVMGDITYDLPVDVTTAENIEKVQTAVESFASNYEKAVAIAKFAMANTADEISAWYTAYYNKYEFNADAEITKVVNEVKGTADFVKRIGAKAEAMPLSEIKAYMYESALLAGICELADAKVKDIILDFTTYFPIDRASYDKLSSANKAYVIGQVAGVSYSTCDAVADIFDEKVSALSEGSSGGSTGGGGGGRKPTGGMTTVVPEDNKEAEDESKKDVSFRDLAEAKWAEEAILFLCERGVINGNPDGTFKPNDNITRAEFVKLIATSMGLSVSSADVAFGDVSADSWYAPYVAAVSLEGIVNGDEYGNFNPEANITRQDMVTMLYRAVGAESGKASKISFTDRGKISDYAEAAVGYFADKAIVNGFEDGSFGPLQNATRAEAAMIFYKLIKTEL